jgi:hypothetical protein
MGGPFLAKGTLVFRLRFYSFNSLQDDLEFLCDRADVLWLEDALVIAWARFHLNAAGGETSPPHFPIEGTDERVTSGAEQDDPARVRLGLVLEPGLDVRSPESPLVLRTR